MARLFDSCKRMPLRYLENLDDVTHGPRAFSDPVGRATDACENMPEQLLLTNFCLLTMPSK